MVKFIIGLIIFGLIALAIIILVVINFSYKSLRQFRKTVEDQYELHQKRKEQKEKNPFGDDYFKGSGGKQEQTQQKTKNNTARKTTTSSGVTIIDGRDSEDKRKIFDHSDGEYVEFEEV